MRRPRKTPFNGAPPSAFDHDRNGRPGGDAGASPARIAMVDVDHGVIVIGHQDPASTKVRPATHQDLAIHGRLDLADHLKR